MILIKVMLRRYAEKREEEEEKGKKEGEKEGRKGGRKGSTLSEQSALDRRVRDARHDA